MTLARLAAVGGRDAGVLAALGIASAAASETATIHVRLTNGQESEHTISAPAYIVPAGTVGGPRFESFWIVGPNGEELFRYEEPSPETGVPPPPPPSPGC